MKQKAFNLKSKMKVKKHRVMREFLSILDITFIPLILLFSQISENYLSLIFSDHRGRYFLHFTQATEHTFTVQLVLLTLVLPDQQVKIKVCEVLSLQIYFGLEFGYICFQQRCSRFELVLDTHSGKSQPQLD